METKIKIVTTIKNGVKSVESYENGAKRELYAISQHLTETLNADGQGIFTDGRVSMTVDQGETHSFIFSPEMSYQDRVDMVRKYFTRNDVVRIEEYNITT